MDYRPGLPLPPCPAPAISTWYLDCMLSLVQDGEPTLRFVLHKQKLEKVRMRINHASLISGGKEKDFM